MADDFPNPNDLAALPVPVTGQQIPLPGTHATATSSVKQERVRVRRPWYDWTTPFGIAIWLLSFGLFVVLLHLAGILP